MVSAPDRSWLQRYVVTAADMQRIEGRMFAAGLPVAALMEKVAARIAQTLMAVYPTVTHRRWGVLVGPGHNGGDALVVARELYLQGYDLQIYQPLEQAKDLTEAHRCYGRSLGIPWVNEIEELRSCDGILDGLFGFGLTRSIAGELKACVDAVNTWALPVISIDLPSGIHTDTGEVMGAAVRATHTFCLGLWKQACFQSPALPWLGQLRLIDFDIPQPDVEAVLGAEPAVARLSAAAAWGYLPLPRSPVAHKYRAGQLLVVAGSHTYAGAAVLTALGARASGVGMVALAVPQSLKSLMHQQLPEALVLPCAETPAGAIACLPSTLDWGRYQAVACGPGLSSVAAAVMESVLGASVPLVLDADGLNWLATAGVERLQRRSAPTVLTPHPGEFQRLFPELWQQHPVAGDAAKAAATAAQAVVVLKQGRSAIATPQRLWYLDHSTPALARGGSGDVLTGLLGGLLAQGKGEQAPVQAALAAVWWHAQAALAATAEYTELGVDPTTLATALPLTLKSMTP